MRYDLVDRRYRWVAWGLLLAMPALVGAQDQAPTPPTPLPSDPVIDQLVEAHNRERAKEKLPPLRREGRLEQAARAHARDMADRYVMSHEGGDGSTPAQRVARSGYKYLSTGENVAEGYDDVSKVMQGWMDSPPHKKNILGDFTEVGLARVDGKDGKPYWCADFGKPMPQFDPATAAADLVKRVNEERAAAKLGPLASDPRLSKPAQAIAAESAKSKGKEGTPPSFDGIEAKVFRELAMTTSAGQPDADTLVKALMENPDYKARLLGEFSKVGVGYATAEDGMPFWCLILGLPARR